MSAQPRQLAAQAARHYPDSLKAAASWMRRAKRRQDANIRILGGGWWQVWGRKVQGFGPLAYLLVRRGILRSRPDGRWEVVEPPAGTPETTRPIEARTHATKIDDTPE